MHMDLEWKVAVIIESDKKLNCYLSNPNEVPTFEKVKDGCIVSVNLTPFRIGSYYDIKINDTEFMHGRAMYGEKGPYLQFGVSHIPATYGLKIRPSINSS